MKTITTLAVIILCSSMTLHAQPSDIGPCQIALDIPAQFVETDIVAEGYVYEHRKNKSQLLLSKTSPEESLFELKTVAMERYDQLVSSNLTTGQSIEKAENGDGEFFILKHIEGEKEDTMCITALSSRCGMLYEFTLTTDVRDAEEMTELFYVMLASTTLPEEVAQ